MTTMTETSRLLDGVKHIHFIGCGGSGMYPLIQILAAKGYELSGSDVLEGSIPGYERKLGVKVTIGHNAENVKGADLVVYSAAIAHSNVEVSAAQALGIPTVERSILLGYVSRLYPKSICVAGTHGKTTATSLITTALQLAGRDPSAVIGGKLPLIGGYGKAGSGEHIAIEACEFSETFLHLAPTEAILLNIDNDHLDYYGTMENLKAAFRRFCALSSDKVYVNADDQNSMEVAATLTQPLVTFGINSETADFRAVNVHQHKPGFYGFDLVEKGVAAGQILLSAPGRHNVYNALAMCAVCRTLGLTVEDCAAAALNFKGAGRRFEIYGECNGALVVDDYAHHPTELEATLKTAKSMGYKRVVAVHQPFTFSRTRTLLNEFAQVLQLADVVVLTPILGSREVDDGSVKTADLAAKIPGCIEVDSLEAAANWVKQNCGAGDLVLTLGCGDVYKASKMMTGQPL